MKVLPFTILVPDDKSVISEMIAQPHFYPHFHRHDEWQVTWIQKGEGTLLAGNDLHAFQSGDIFVIGAKLPHLFKSNPEYFLPDSQIEIKALSLYFNPAGLMAPLFNLPEMKLSTAFLTKMRHGFKVPKAMKNEFYSRIIDIHNAGGSNRLHHFLEFLDRLNASSETAASLCSNLYSPDFSESEGMRLSKIINFITLNYNHQISLEDVADSACMTRQGFCRYFKKHTGHTFVSFLNEVRVNDACKSLVLGESSESISGVAFRVGFNSITNFNRVFKQVIGQTPRDYVDRYRQISRVNYAGA
ncbi:helix-turn-helix transcriptional regulator [Pedobacter sp. N36a]|uniref:AraC family transcriptional regulator n=1 Tax=Pedobacter sp. N36a TaxID=2767996 RepID=UPI0016573661|nr:AraC family transcriptional regulator [Pedobacter sp. N36a]MBC8988122.1 helix-turn-helix transcriptional regulator [Pedobacter sp. N36a]